MSTFETSTIVGGQGDIHVAGVPFQPGTEVEVVISPRSQTATSPADAKQRIESLLAALDHAHNSEPIGPLRREEL